MTQRHQNIPHKDSPRYHYEPQPTYERSKAYLEDIAQGHWLPLRHVRTLVRLGPVVGVPHQWHASILMGFHLRKYNKTPFLNEIKQGKRLKKNKTNDRSRGFNKDLLKGWKMAKPTDRKALNKQITSFHLSSLRTTGFMELPFLSEVSRRNWSSLKHVPTQVETQPVVDVPYGWDSKQTVHLKKFNKTPLLGEIQHGTPLKHVPTQDMSGGHLEEMKDFKLKHCNREVLNSEIEHFQESTLHHSGSN